MNSLAAISFFLGVVAVASAGVLPLVETESVWRGPIVRSTVLEADGVGYRTHVEGGAIATTRDLAVAVPEVVVARSEPEFLHTSVVPSVHSVPVWEHGRSDIIAGPSGTIVANKDYDIAPIHKEVYLEPSVRTVLPYHGLTYGRSLYGDRFFGYDGLHGYGRSLLW